MRASPQASVELTNKQTDNTTTTTSISRHPFTWNRHPKMIRTNVISVFTKTLLMNQDVQYALSSIPIRSILCLRKCSCEGSGERSEQGTE